MGRAGPGKSAGSLPPRDEPGWMPFGRRRAEGYKGESTNDFDVTLKGCMRQHARSLVKAFG